MGGLNRDPADIPDPTDIPKPSNPNRSLRFSHWIPVCLDLIEGTSVHTRSVAWYRTSFVPRDTRAPSTAGQVGGAELCRTKKAG